MTRLTQSGPQLRRSSIALSSTMGVGWTPRCVTSVTYAQQQNGRTKRQAILSPPADLPDRYSGGAPGDQKKVRRHIVKLDAHRDALRQTHPAEGRIDGSQQLAACAAVLVLDAVSDALDVPR